MKYSVGVDIGGTNIAAGIVDEDKKIVYQKIIPVKEVTGTGEMANEIVHLIHELLTELQINLNEIYQIGVVVPGTANRKTKKVEYANNLEFCQGDLIQLLEEKLEHVVAFENDANAAAWGEYLVLKEKPQSMVMITLGTGIGAGIIMNGQIYHGCNDAAGEIGHMTVQMDGFQCNCGRRGCWEVYASATALGLQARAAMQWKKESYLWKLCHWNSENIDAKAVVDAIRLKDETACEVFHQYIDYLSIGIVNLVNLMQPDLIVIGGGLSNAGDLLLQPLQQRVQENAYSRDSEQNTKLQLAVLKNDAGILGVALLEDDI